MPEPKPTTEPMPRFRAMPVKVTFYGAMSRLENSRQKDVFWQCVLELDLSPHAPVRYQPNGAERLVELARSRGVDPTEAFRREDMFQRATLHLKGAAGAMRMMASHGQRIVEELKRWPKDRTVPVSSEFRNDLRLMTEILSRLGKVI